MNISDSPLFKEYARPVLNPEARRGRAMYSPLGILDTTIQYLLDLAKLEVTRFKISDAAENSFCLTIESRLVGTGTVSTTIDAMNADLSFNGTKFGKVKLPEIQTSFWGTKLVIQEQRIDITNRATYHTFVRSLIVDDETSLQLESNGCTVRALGTSSTCDLHLDMPLKAVGGPRIALKKLSRSGENMTTTFNLNNPGPVEIDHGTCIFELHNGHSETQAELKGELNIARGQSEVILHGTTRNDVVPSHRTRLVGVGVEGNKKSWLSETIREVDAVFDLEPKYAELLWR
ncbi:hypothetical protein FSARC_6667 [Fusarium sarcochroum]|uniref:Uncharacterized protein n=1 Tax=Fusarium sarcochroum TaxID=1208366 RepID=A0A8H4X946_9HYPO|nr:hypothetical protein FSARC_6667 [Fusarium sarcochroum]